jgi:AAA domain-containing protein
MPSLISTHWTDSENEEHYLKALICGPPKSGKTSLGATAPNPIIVACEPGLITLRRLHVPYVDVRSVADLKLVLTALRQDPESRAEALGLGDYRLESVVVDVLDEAQRLFIADRLAETGKAQLQGWEDYQQLASKMRSMVKAFMSLDLNVVLLCHLSDREDDKGRVETLPMMQGGFRDEVAQYVDVAAILQVRQEVVLTDSGPESQLQRILRTRPDARSDWLGDRLCVLPAEYLIQERANGQVTTDLTDLIHAAFGKPAAKRAKVKSAPAAVPVGSNGGHPQAASSTAPQAAAPVPPTAPDQALPGAEPVGADMATAQEPSVPATAVALAAQPFAFQCESCGADVSDPNRDQWELSEYRKKQHLCVSCYQNTPNV